MMIDEETEKYREKVTNFFIWYRKQYLDIETKQKLYEFILGFDDRTDKQKRRFILYYNLLPEADSKCRTYCEIARMEGCTCNAVTQSVVRMMRALRGTKDKDKDFLLEIIDGKN